MGRLWQFSCILVICLSIGIGSTNAKPPSRIVGGEDGNIGEFPYMASVRKGPIHKCGGTIIGKRHILTACHCVALVSDKPEKEMSIVTGTNSIAPGAGATHAIKSVVVHPDCSTTVNDSMKNDIAVIALTADINFDVFTKLAQLPTEDTAENMTCVGSGWGAMSYPKGMEPNNIRKIGMTTVSNEDCQKHYRAEILNTHLCALKSAGIGLCTGDSGGPLVHDGTVVGIASFVMPCGRGIPDVFTRVYTYIDFIKKAMISTE